MVVSQGIRIAAEAGVREPVPSQTQVAPRVLSAPIQTEQESWACHSGGWEPTWEAQVPPFPQVPWCPLCQAAQLVQARAVSWPEGERGGQVSCEHLWGRRLASLWALRVSEGS